MPRKKKTTSSSPSDVSKISKARGSSVLSNKDDDNYVRRPNTIATDSYRNVPARLGEGTPNLAQAGDYPLVRLTQNYPLIQSLYRGSWVIRKVIDQIAEDVYKSFPILDIELPPDQIALFNKTVKKTRTLDRLRTGRKWGRLFGGGAAIIVIDGHDDLMQPLKLDDIQLGSYKGLIPLDRWSGIIPGPEINSDINDPTSFGLPTYYDTMMDAGNVKIHHSRIIRFEGRELPQWEKQVELYWGMSEVEIVFDELRKRDYSSWNIVSLLTRAQVLSIEEPQLATLMSGAGGSNTAYNNFSQRMESISQLLNNQGLLVLGKDGKLQQTAYGFGGISEMYHEFMKDLAASCEIPYELIFGREGGLSNTGESGLQLYYDKIEQKRSADDGEVIEQIMPIIAMSTWGFVPDDLDYHWAPTRTMTERERMDMATVTTATVVQAYTADLITKQQAVMELAAASDRNGMFTNITTESINSTPKLFASEQGMGELTEAPVGGGGPVSGNEETEETEKPEESAKASDSIAKDSVSFDDPVSLINWISNKINLFRARV